MTVQRLVYSILLTGLSHMNRKSELLRVIGCMCEQERLTAPLRRQIYKGPRVPDKRTGVLLTLTSLSYDWRRTGSTERSCWVRISSGLYCSQRYGVDRLDPHPRPSPMFVDTSDTAHPLLCVACVKGRLLIISVHDSPELMKACE